jgi:hypothetical protein
MKTASLDAPGTQWQWAQSNRRCVASFLSQIGSPQQIYTKFHYHIEWFCVARLFGCLKTWQKAEIGVKIQHQWVRDH